MSTNQTIYGFNRTQLKQWFLYWTVLGLGLFILIFLITSTWIGVEVQERCLAAQSQYSEDDCVKALSQVLNNTNNSYRSRNQAIWTLGQIGDRRALPIIEKYYTGNIPETEPYHQTLSQYEMKKAINLINGGLNITHIVWK